MDGDFNLGGILKGTTEGIRGPELSYLGKSMGVNDTLIPTTTAVLGSIAGAAAGRLPGIRGNKVRTIGSLVGGGLAGLVGGQAAGGALEENRRRQRFEERNPNTHYDSYKEASRELLDRKYRLMQENPQAAEEKAKSKTGFSKRSQQQALLDEALKQQVTIDQLIDEERKQRALDANQKRAGAMQRFDEIEASIGN